MREDIYRFKDVLFSTALALTHDVHEAEDLVQETFYKALKSWQTFKKGSNLGGWLYRILKNTHTDLLRKQRRMPFNSVQINDRVKEQDTCSENSNDFIRLFSIIEEDVGTFSAICLLLQSEGYTYEEIGNKMNKTIATVKSTIFKARQSLKKCQHIIDYWN